MTSKSMLTTLLSRLQEVDLVFPIFFSHFYFLFDLFSFILFLELELGLKAMRLYGHTTDHIR